MNNSVNIKNDKSDHGKPVSLFELFYDLVFVYAIANLTKVLEHTENGTITSFRGLLYLVIAVQVMETWLYQTNYNNRFCSGKWYEIVLMYSHFGIVLGIDLITVGQTLILEGEKNTLLVGKLMLAGILLFYLCMFANGVYYGRRLWSKAEIIANLVLMVAAAAVIALIHDGRAYLMTMLLLSGAVFALLLHKKSKMK